MQALYDIQGAKLTALEISLLAHIAGDECGVWQPQDEEAESVREQLDTLVLEGFLERDRIFDTWLNSWRVSDDAWVVIEPYVDVIHRVINNIAEA